MYVEFEIFYKHYVEKKSGVWVKFSAPQAKKIEKVGLKKKLPLGFD